MPAEHSTQKLLALVLACLPAAHGKQAVAAALGNVPARHSRHSTEASCGWTLPAEQLTQDETEGAATILENRPGAQGKQVDTFVAAAAVEYLPVEQLLQNEAAEAPEYRPAEHLTHSYAPAWRLT